MQYIKLTNENIEKEHICCAISNNKDIQVSSKKHGYLSDLLNACIEDSKNKGKKGLCILAAASKFVKMKRL